MKGRHDRLRGLAHLVADAVEHGSAGVERVHLAIAARPFAVAELVPPIAGPAKELHALYDLSVGATYGMVRLGNRLVAKGIDAAIDLAEASTEP